MLASIERELHPHAAVPDGSELDEKLDSLQSEIQYIRTLLEATLSQAGEQRKRARGHGNPH